MDLNQLDNSILDALSSYSVFNMQEIYRLSSLGLFLDSLEALYILTTKVSLTCLDLYSS